MAENNLSDTEFKKYKAAIEDLDDFTNLHQTKNSNANAAYIQKSDSIYINADKLLKDVPIDRIASTLLHETTHKIQKMEDPESRSGMAHEGQAYYYQFQMQNALSVDPPEPGSLQAYVTELEAQSLPDYELMEKLGIAVQNKMGDLYGKMPKGNANLLPDIDGDGIPG